jgi:hypothetical protein
LARSSLLQDSDHSIGTFFEEPPTVWAVSVPHALRQRRNRW